MADLLNTATILALFTFMSSCQSTSDMEEKQLTHDLSYHHDLDNNDNFSPDGRWLVYDTRTDDGGIAESAKIERVNIETGEIEVLYAHKDNNVWGPGAGAVSYSPGENSVVFIHGLLNSSKENPYQQWRRTGVIVKDDNPGTPIYMDARDVTFPFTPGALRGGTHRHEYSGDGQWIGYTYNDAILKALEDSTGVKRNLRTMGVSKNVKAVKVDENGENISGEWYSALVVRVVPEPAPGSDDISQAASDSWVGKKGYQKPDGSWQMARAFLGATRNEKGETVLEVYVVDIPDDITQPGPYGPLEGTATEFPMPPKGTVQRRLTFTAKTGHPGCAGIVRSSPDGKLLSYLAKDEKGIQQIFLISPFGGTPRQLTEHDSNVSGSVRWHPDGQHVSYVHKGSIQICALGDEPFEKRVQVLTAPSTPAPTNMVWSPDGKTIAFNKLVKGEDAQEGSQQVFVKKVTIK